MSFSTETLKRRDELINKKRTGVNGTSEWVAQALKDQAVKESLKKSNKPQKQPLEPSKDIIEVITEEEVTKTENRQREASRKYHFDEYENLPEKEKKLLDFIIVEVFKSGGKRVGEFYIVDIPSMKIKIENFNRNEINSYTKRLCLRGCLSYELIRGGKYSIKRYLIHFKILDSSPANVVRNLY